ncbi:MAG: hypothetical protein FWD97_04915 [Defluviitaleaceae bacterium]|nr:hypothetical protein [Defluviitaleaceae bacterium]
MQKLLRSEIVTAGGFFFGSLLFFTMWLFGIGFDNLVLPALAGFAGFIYAGLYMARIVKIAKLKKTGKTYNGMVTDIRADSGTLVRSGYRMDCGYTNQAGEWRVVTTRNHMLGSTRKTEELLAVIHVDESHPKRPFEVEIYRKLS